MVVMEFKAIIVKVIDLEVMVYRLNKFILLYGFKGYVIFFKFFLMSSMNSLFISFSIIYDRSSTVFPFLTMKSVYLQK